MKKKQQLLCFFLITVITLASVITAGASSDALWSVKLGKNYRTAPTVPTVSNGYVYSISGKKIYKMDAALGTQVAQGDTCDTPGYACYGVTVYENTIYAPLTGGKVQAFDCDSLESLWVYADSLSGQALTEVTVTKTYVFAGFWNNDDEDASFVCLDRKKGELNWKIEKTGGFYWSRACVVEDKYVLIGHDDGTVFDNKESEVLVLDINNGNVISKANIIGDQRSGIIYSNEYSKIFFTTTAGYLYSAKLDDGQISDTKYVSIGIRSTSTPLVLGGRVYVGSQTENGGRINVLDSDLNAIYTLDAPGHVQAPLTAFFTKDGKVNLYFTVNAAPGGIYMFTDPFDDSVPQIVTVFEPKDTQAGFCISPVIRNNGTLYYKNDSGNIFAVDTGNVSFFQYLFNEILRPIFNILNELGKIFQ